MNWLYSILFGRSKAELDGDEAYRDGKSEDRNPYADGTAEHSEWRRGFFGKAILILAVLALGCDHQPSSDEIQRQQQEAILKEATSQVGMPAIKNFRERKMLKDILELRDQDGITTYTYLYSDMTGKLIFFGETIGYGIPYATQFTSPEKVLRIRLEHYATVPQADPNGLFSPASAEGTWVLMKDPNGKDVHPVYVEPRLVVSPFKLLTDQ